MNSLPKFVRDRLRTEAPRQHPDAEVLSAFAENALPATEREAIVEHLSACTHCRDIVFLAAPPASEQQQVFAAPRARPYFALRWGTLVACLAIGGLLLLSHRLGFRPNEPSSSAKTTSVPVPEKLAAQEKIPADLESMRDKQFAFRVVPPPPPPPARGHAEPKQSSAQPSSRMVFDDSGEVSVSRGAQSYAPAPSIPPRELKELPVEGRNVNELAKSAPANHGGPVGGVVGGMTANRATDLAATAPGVSAGSGNGAGKAESNPVSAQNARSGLALVDLPASKDQSLASGYVAGTVFDVSGAVVANAKVTATGPLGEKTVVSDGAGKFSFDALTAGTYVLKVDAAGFQKALSQVAVLSNKPAMADFKLQPGTTTEAVMIEATAAPTERPSAADQKVEANAETVNSLEPAPAQMAIATAKKRKADQRGRGALERLDVGQQFSLSTQGKVQRSSDGGKTWVPVAVAEGSVFRSVASSGNQVWAAGNAGLLYRSLDGGQHWTHVIPVSNGAKIQADITQIQFPDPQHVVLRSAAGASWASADGGETWVSQ
jgi:hypothetical protein